MHLGSPALTGCISLDTPSGQRFAGSFCLPRVLPVNRYGPLSSQAPQTLSGVVLLFPALPKKDAQGYLFLWRTNTLLAINSSTLYLSNSYTPVHVISITLVGGHVLFFLSFSQIFLLCPRAKREQTFQSSFCSSFSWGNKLNSNHLL